MTEPDTSRACARDLQELKRLDNVIHDAQMLICGRLERACERILRLDSSPRICCSKSYIGFSRFVNDPFMAVFYSGCTDHYEVQSRFDELMIDPELLDNNIQLIDREAR